MAHGDVDGEHALAAGDFSSWLVDIQGALRGERGSDVPCGGCTACCTSSQFIHIAPDEAETLSHIPAGLLFPAPRLPRGHVVLGYDERGHCPMLIDSRCSIYEHRPRTCRAYDCRVLSAAGLETGDDKTLIGQQVRRWEFSFPSDDDRTLHEAVRAATVFLGEHRDRLPDTAVPANPTQLAALAIEMHDVFLRHDEETDRTTVIDPDIALVRSEVMRRTAALDAT